MNTREVVVSYEDTCSAWGVIEPRLQKYLPLHEVSIAHDGVTHRLPPLCVHFLPHDPVGGATSLAVNLFRKPYLYLYLLDLEDTDVYKNETKAKLKLWAQNHSDRQQEWLIVHCVLGKRSFGSDLLRIRTSVFDRIKSDFSSKKERAVQLKLEAGSNDGFAELKQRVQESVQATLQTHIQLYKGEAKKLFETRDVPGWNYCNFFVIQEGLAFTYERAGLFTNALELYEGLETMFFEGKGQETYPSIFFHMDRLELMSDLSLFNWTNPEKVPCHDLIYQNNISLFDFLVYLCARKINLHISKGDVTRAASLCFLFVHQLAHEMEANLDKLPRGFKEVFIYTVCLDAVDATTKHASSSQLADELFSHAVADLLYYARLQLDHLGFQLDLLADEAHDGQRSAAYHMCFSPMVRRTKPVPGSPPSVDLAALKPFCPPKLLTALTSHNTFDELYILISGKAAKNYNKAKQLRRCVHVNGEIAAIHFKRKLYQKAESLLKAIADVYMSDGWTRLVSSVLCCLGVCQEKLSHLNDLVATCLQLLRPKYVAPDKESLVDKLVDVATTKLTTVVTRDMHNHPASPPAGMLVNDPDVFFFEAKLTHGSAYRVGDTIELVISLNSYLPKEITLTSIVVKFASIDDNESKVFLKNDTVVSPGLNTLHMQEKCDKPSSYRIHQVWLLLGKLHMAYPFTVDQDLPVHDAAAALSFTVIPSLPALTVQLHAPDLFVPATRQHLLCLVCTGADELVTGSVRVRIPEPLALSELNSQIVIAQTRPHGDSPCDDEQPTSQHARPFALRSGTDLPSAPPHSLLSFLIPIELPADVAVPDQPVEIAVDVTYVKATKEENTVTATRPLTFVIPFGVELSPVCLPAPLLSDRVEDPLAASTTPTLGVCATLTSLSPVPVRVSDVELGLPPTAPLRVCPPSALVQRVRACVMDKALHTGNTLSVYFEAAGKEPDSSSTEACTCVIVVYFIPENNGFVASLPDCLRPFIPAITKFSHERTLTPPPSPALSVRLRHAPLTAVGAALPLCIELHAYKDLQDSGVLFELHADRDAWMVAGQCRQQLHLKAGEQLAKTIELVPLRAGRLPKPSVSLHGLAPRDVRLDLSPHAQPYVDVQPCSHAHSYAYRFVK